MSETTTVDANNSKDVRPNDRDQFVETSATCSSCGGLNNTTGELCVVCSLKKKFNQLEAENKRLKDSIRDFLKCDCEEANEGEIMYFVPQHQIEQALKGEQKC